jgi:hypothetical protein
MKKLLAIFLSSILICFSLAATALAQDLDCIEIDRVACPNSVKIGNSLTVTVYVKNECLTDITVTRAMIGLVGTGNTLEKAVTWGPYHRVISLPLGPGGTAPLSIQIVSAVPASLANKMALATVGFLSDDGDMEDVPVGACMVLVTPY